MARYHILSSPAPVHSVRDSSSGSFGSVPTAAHPPPPVRSYSGKLVGTCGRQLNLEAQTQTHSYLGHHLPMSAQFACRFASFFGVLLGQLVRSRHIYSPLLPLAHSCLVHSVYPLHPSIQISFFLLARELCFSLSLPRTIPTVGFIGFHCMYGWMIRRIFDQKRNISIWLLLLSTDVHTSRIALRRGTSTTAGASGRHFPIPATQSPMLELQAHCVHHKKNHTVYIYLGGFCSPVML